MQVEEAGMGCKTAHLCSELCSPLSLSLPSPQLHPSVLVWLSAAVAATEALHMRPSSKGEDLAWGWEEGLGEGARRAAAAAAGLWGVCCC